MIVRPGEKIPLDGLVDAGQSHVNQAPITGESLPVLKEPGDEVFGRSHQRPRRARGDRDAPAPGLDPGPNHSPRRARSSAARAEPDVRRSLRARLHADRAGAGVSRSPWCRRSFLVGGADWSTWIYRSLVLLVISCPCALVISTPVSIVSALAAAARKGVLIKGGARLERLAAVRCIAFDKTGTLTRGRLRVTDVVPLNGAAPVEILALAASLESRSEHPIAQAIVARAVADDVAADQGRSRRSAARTRGRGTGRWSHGRGRQPSSVRRARVGRDRQSIARHKPLAARRQKHRRGRRRWRGDRRHRRG